MLLQFLMFIELIMTTVSMLFYRGEYKNRWRDKLRLMFGVKISAPPLLFEVLTFPLFHNRLINKVQ